MGGGRAIFDHSSILLLPLRFPLLGYRVVSAAIAEQPQLNLPAPRRGRRVEAIAALQPVEKSGELHLRGEDPIPETGCRNGDAARDRAGHRTAECDHVRNLSERVRKQGGGEQGRKTAGSEAGHAAGEDAAAHRLPACITEIDIEAYVGVVVGDSVRTDHDAGRTRDRVATARP